MGIHEALTLLSFRMHHWAIFKAHLYFLFQFYLNSLSEAMYMWSVLQLNKTCQAVSVVI